MSPIDPETTKVASEGLSIFAKIASMVMAFVGGVVAATWAVAHKVSGYDARIAALESANQNINDKIDKKLDRLHERIDEVLLARGDGNVHARSDRMGGYASTD